MSEIAYPAAGELVYRALDPELLSVREGSDGGAPVLNGRMMPYNEWTEINSAVEGHFLERFAPGSLAKTLKERGNRIRVLFEHGYDSLGKQPIATFDGFRDEEDGAYFDASLLRGLPELIVDGLRRGVYGSSIRFRPVEGKWDRVERPEPSESNPDGIPEHTIREAYVKEFSVVTFPAYEGATAQVRSLTDEIAAKRLLGDERALELIQKKDEPQHSNEEPQEDPASPVSRSTQPGHDYLRPKRGGTESWRL